MELNPNHKTVQTMHDQWHKLALLLMIKFGEHSVMITSEDLDSLCNLFPGDMPAIAISDKADGIHLDVIPLAEGQHLARAEGGLPS